MANLFSVPIFFVLFRESLEAAIIVSVLLGIIEQIVRQPEPAGLGSKTLVGSDREKTSGSDTASDVDPSVAQKRLIRKLRIQVFAGAGIGLFIALAIGAAFLAVYYTKLVNLWAQSEELWEGIFSLIAAIMIFIMALAMLRMDKAKAKWRVKLAAAFHERPTSLDDDHHGGRTSKYALFLLPFLTVLREGLEAVIFVGGVSLLEPASSIPIAAIVGLICGLLVGVVIYFAGRRVNVSFFLVFSTAFLLLIGAGLFSKCVGYFQSYQYAKLVGGDIAETGTGPGSYDTRGNVWHLTYGNVEGPGASGGYQVFNALFGWSNNGTIGTILAYCFYWIAVVVALVIMKWKEGRMTFFGRESAAARRRRERREKAAVAPQASPVSSSADGSDKQVQ